jgi:CBS domain-containing protein
MRQVADVMTRGVRSMAPTDTLQLAAQAMDELNVGALPVCDHERVVGVLTDRDIVVRAVAQGRPAQSTPLSEVMSGDVECVCEDDPLEEVSEKMEQHQIRRMPVLSTEGKLVGMLSLGDLAAKAHTPLAGEALAGISQPAAPDRSGNTSAAGAAAGGSASGAAQESESPP